MKDCVVLLFPSLLIIYGLKRFFIWVQRSEITSFPLPLNKCRLINREVNIMPSIVPQCPLDIIFFSGVRLQTYKWFQYSFRAIPRHKGAPVFLFRSCWFIYLKLLSSSLEVYYHFTFICVWNLVSFPKGRKGVPEQNFEESFARKNDWWRAERNVWQRAS